MVESWVHPFFEGLAFVIAWFVRRHMKIESSWQTMPWRYVYGIFVALGSCFGAFVLGSANALLSFHGVIGQSILGAIIGGIIGAELFKWRYGIEGSTGGSFVPSLALGIAVGRLGCFFDGMEDFTYGTPTSYPWGVDSGDGILRHPVALYESLAMGLFFWYSWVIFYRNRVQFDTTIFYQFAFFYGFQRFLWEFLKPYERVAGLSVFQWGSLVLIVYGWYSWRRSRG